MVEREGGISHGMDTGQSDSCNNNDDGQVNSRVDKLWEVGARAQGAGADRVPGERAKYDAIGRLVYEWNGVDMYR